MVERTSGKGRGRSPGGEAAAADEVRGNRPQDGLGCALVPGCGRNRKRTGNGWAVWPQNPAKHQAGKGGVI